MMAKSKKKSKKAKRFKCFVEFNGERYSINTNKCSVDWIEFNRVIESISQTVGSDVSFETHSFEVFDDIFKVYIKLRFSDSLIKNQSLIRVLSNNTNNIDINRNLIQTNSQLKANDSSKEFESNGTEVELSSETRSQKSTLTVSSVESKTRLELYRNMSTDGDLIDLSLTQTVCQCLDQLSHLLVTDSILFWQKVSLRMKTEFHMKGMDEFESQIRFEELLYKYINLMKSIDSLDESSIDWICYDCIKTVDLSLFLDPNVYKTIIANLKPIGYKMAENLFKDTNNEQIVKLNAKQLLDSEVVSDSTEGDTRLMSETDGQDLNGETVKQDIDSTDNLMQDLIDFESKPSVEVNRKQSREKQLKSKLSPTEKDRFNSILAKTIYDLEMVSKFNWTLVAQTMQCFGYKGFDEKMCKNRFGAVISKYINVMKESESESKAVSDWPAFRFMNAIDMKTFVNENTYDRIEWLKQKFESNPIRSNSVAETEPKANEQNWKYDDIRDYFLAKLVADSQSNSEEKTSIPFWHSITYKMIFVCNFKNQGLVPFECKTRFERLIYKYIDVLQTAQSLEEARNQMISFDYLDKIDLKLFLDSNLYQTVLGLKTKLALREHQINSSEAAHPTTSSAEHLTNGSTVDNIRTNGQNSNFSEIAINYELMPPNRKKDFQNLCFDQMFQKLLEIQVMDGNTFQRKLVNSDTEKSQIHVFRKNNLLYRNHIRNRNQLKNILERILKESGIQCVVHMFGSTVNSIGFLDSDLNLFIEIQELNNLLVKTDLNRAMGYIIGLKTLFADCLDLYIPNLPVPIISIDFNNIRQKFISQQKSWQSLQTLNSIKCNITVTNGLYIRNTKLIQLFCEYEKRFRDLAVILKFWAKTNGFIGSNAMTSYAFTQLVVFFCQTQSPALLPTLDQLRNLSNESLIVDGWESSFCDDKTLIPNTGNTDSVLILLAKFFKFYANFDFTTQVIQPKTGLAILKTSKNGYKTLDELQMKTSAVCYIEDPFNLSENLTENLNPIVFNKFIQYITHIAMKSDLIFSPIRSKCWGIMKIITKFDPTDPSLSNVGHNLYLQPKSICATNIPINGRSEYGRLEQIMTNEFCDTTLCLLENVFEIKSQLMAKCEVTFKEFSLFGDFAIELNAINLQLIDLTNREIIREQFKPILIGKTVFNREKAISDEIIARFRGQILPNISIKCRFCLYFNDYWSNSIIDYKIIDINAHLELVNAFLNTIVELIPQIIDENYTNL